MLVLERHTISQSKRVDSKVMALQIIFRRGQEAVQDK
jgi:hypothetical protein